ncbi:hypothetical protein [Novosphingobium sp. fls2-241-R2A-195]|jgi:hypothetical protein|uniref:hypothetical protein n=1 Tax=Novosphingobium sp. fls2-241-R2A-195 TaxID=3040296 RepID=UPI00254BB9A8|nr:hypothetical protein [Novosphingobium sp. fls2-241-R2A-195]
MTPDPIIRLASVVQTLEHVVVPAVDSGNLLAVEQCGVVLAQLRMLERHMPLIGAYHALCLTDLLGVVAALPTVEGGPAAVMARCELAEACAHEDDPRIAFHRVGRALEGLVRAMAQDGEPAVRSAIDAAVLAFSIRQARRARSWFQDAGFDHDADSLPTVEAMVAGN